MNGLNEELCPNIINMPTSMSITIMGASHHAFLTLRKSHSSAIRGLFGMLSLQAPYLLIFRVLFRVPCIPHIVFPPYEETAHNKAVYSCAHHALVCVMRSAHYRLPAHVERCIDY